MPPHRTSAPKYPAGVDADHVDQLVEQWRTVRPELQLAPMATFGRLGRIHAHATRAIESVFDRHGLTIGEFDVLAALRRTGEPHVMTPTALSRLLMLSPAGMTNRLDRLAAAGLIERRPDPDDRRSSLVVLTKAGRQRVDAAVTEHVANEAGLLGALTKAERRTFDQLLRKLLAGLEPGD
jgi:DNA-binding MarR family transcriptional regulator